jgi:hypothetical protein
MRIILVEGFPGCGKSATAQWLARQIRATGRPAEWFYEEQRPHPLVSETAAPSASWREYFAKRLERWSALARRARPSGTVEIFESAWLQVPLFHMLRDDLHPGVIRAFIRKTVEIIREADPSLIYLSQPDPEGGMKWLFDRRGMSWTLFHVGRRQRHHRGGGYRSCADWC